MTSAFQYVLIVVALTFSAPFSLVLCAFFSFSAAAAHFVAQVSVQRERKNEGGNSSVVEEPPLQMKFAFSLWWLFQTSKDIFEYAVINADLRLRNRFCAPVTHA